MPMSVDDTIKNLGLELVREADTQGRNLVRQMLARSAKKGLPKELAKYLFFTVVEQKATWPAMPPSSVKALSVGVSLMLDAGVVPDYRTGMSIPQGDQESDIDQLIKDIAFWCVRDMTISLLQTYSRLLEKYAPAFALARPDISQQNRTTYLDSYLQVTLRQHPGQIPGARAVSSIMRLIF